MELAKELNQNKKKIPREKQNSSDSRNRNVIKNNKIPWEEQNSSRDSLIVNDSR